ncbi:hypothetical protein AB0B15_34085 [Streptomyces sp. NPDC045456]|uniref:hypothetical protein n=1 Tax=Streptomyces sp. NPDC045456 TaxID=3155254 RepID=UPI0033C53851
MSTPPRWFRRKIVLITASVSAALAVTAGTLYFTGFYDRWQDGRQVSRACDGAVAHDELKQYLGVDELTSDRAWTTSARQDRECVIYWPDGKGQGDNVSVRVTLGQGRPSQQLLTDLDRNESYNQDQVVSPIGNGWRGVLGTDRATVVMPCGGKADDDLVVNLRAQPRGHTTGTAEQRARLARIATQTAANAARQAQCPAPSGKEITQVPAAMPEAATRPGHATGTCAGINAPTRETTADPLAPIEDCLVTSPSGTPSFRLAAYYGPFVQNGRPDLSVRGDAFTKPTGGSDGLYWTSTPCPNHGGTAFYTAETLRSSDRFTSPAPTAQQAALAHFAKRSAQAHGCSLSFTTPE